MRSEKKSPISQEGSQDLGLSTIMAAPRRFDTKSAGILAFGRLSDLVGRLLEVFRRLSDVFRRLSDVFGRLSDVFGRLSHGFRTALGYRGRLFANLDGFSLSWTASRRPPIPVFFCIFFSGAKRQKKKCMKHNWRMVDKRGVRSSRRRFNHPAGVQSSRRRSFVSFVGTLICRYPLSWTEYIVRLSLWR